VFLTALLRVVPLSKDSFRGRPLQGRNLPSCPARHDAEVLENAEVSAKAGCFGFIYGRNMWKRKKEHAIEMFNKLAAFLDQSVEQPAFAGGNNRGGVLV